MGTESRAPGVLARVRPVFRALAQTIVPESAGLDENGWQEVESTVETALAARPAAVRRQLGVFIRALDLLPVARFGRTFRRLDPDRRRRFLEGLQRSRVFLVRRGFWGVRTLVFMGYYSRPAAWTAVGYDARLRGWLDHPATPAGARTAALEKAGGGRTGSDRNERSWPGGTEV